MLKRILIIGAILVVVTFGIVAILLSGSQEDTVVVRPEIPFAPLTDPSLKDPDSPIKIFRVDFAKVEHDLPLTRADLMKLTPENLRTLNQEEIDQIYGRLSAGPIPDGSYVGDLFFSRSGDGSADGELVTRLEEVLGGLEGRLAGQKVELLEKIGRALWKGKMFYRDERLLRNFIDDFEPMREIIDEPATLMKANVPREGWLKWLLPNTEVWLLFPAKLYCGQSLLDGRRESVIVDYAYTDEIAGYRASPDSLAGRNGLRIRDEIRMVRPGFYLGRAYTHGVFLLNFTLYNAAVANAGGESFAGGSAIAEDCWIGEQVRAEAP